MQIEIYAPLKKVDYSDPYTQMSGKMQSDSVPQQ